MQAINNPRDETALEVSINPLEDLTIFKLDPDEFKKFFSEDEEKEQDIQSLPQLLNPIQILPLVQTSVSEASGSISTLQPINLEKTLDVLLENMTLLISHIKLTGIEQTSIVIHQEGSILDMTEVVVESYDTAPGALNIEIKSCSKLQALLIHQKQSLFERIEAVAPEVKIHRLDISSIDSKDYISGTKQKKVMMGDKAQNDA